MVDKKENRMWSHSEVRTAELLAAGSTRVVPVSESNYGDNNGDGDSNDESNGELFWTYVD